MWLLRLACVSAWGLSLIHVLWRKLACHAVSSSMRRLKWVQNKPRASNHRREPGSQCSCSSWPPATSRESQARNTHLAFRNCVAIHACYFRVLHFGGNLLSKLLWNYESYPIISNILDSLCLFSFFSRTLSLGWQIYSFPGFIYLYWSVPLVFPLNVLLTGFLLLQPLIVKIAVQLSAWQHGELSHDVTIFCVNLTGPLVPRLCVKHSGCVWWCFGARINIWVDG